MANLTIQPPCWAEIGTGSFPDLQMTGPVNTSNNTATFNSYNGTCSGNSIGMVTIVQAGGKPAADSACQALGERWALLRLQDYYVDVPSDYYWCSPRG